MLDFPLVFLCVCPLHQLKLIHKTTHEYLLRKRHWAFKILGCEYSDDNGQYLFSSVPRSCMTLCNPMNRSRPGLPVHHQLPEFTQTQVHQVGDAIQPSNALSSPSPPAPNPSQHQGIFQWVSPSHQVAKYWSFSFNISPSNEHAGLISFRMDWLDLRAVQGTLASLHQHHSSKISILQRSVFFIVQLSHSYMTSGKNIILTRWTFVDKVKSLLLNMLSKLS